MNIETIKKVIASTHSKHKKFVDYAETGRRYYHCKNDILTVELPQNDRNNPRESNRRIPSNIFKILVEQKWLYMGNKISFYTHYNEDITKEEDVVHNNDPAHTHSEVDEKTKLDKLVKKTLGNQQNRVFRQVFIDAFCTGIGWIHFWKTGSSINTLEDKGEFEYGRVDPCEVTPIWGGNLNRELIGVLRHYIYRDPEDFKQYNVYEYWDKEFCYCYRHEYKESLNELVEFYRFDYYSVESGEYEKTNTYKHGFEFVPFACFRNNEDERSDLEGIKDLIDSLDYIKSQFVNDQADFQKMIFVLSGYGAEPSDDFLEKLKQHKLIKLEGGYTPEGIDPKVETLSIEIPVDAYTASIELDKNDIYEYGMGVPISADDLKYTNGEALKFKYSPLQLKSRISMTCFEEGFNTLVEAICDHLGYKIEKGQVETRWVPGEVINTTDAMNNARLCLGFTSLKTALKANPLVEDVDEEMVLIERERQEEMEMMIPDMDSVRQQGSTNDNSSLSSMRQGQYQINRSESEVKSKQPEKFTMSKKVDNDTKIQK